MRHKAYKNGNSLKFESKNAFLQDLEGFGDGQELEVNLKEWKNSRSLNQNNLMWKWIEIMCPHYANTKKGMYAALINAYAPIYAFQTIDGKTEQTRLTTSQMTTDQMAEFMMLIDQEAAEEGIILPRPIDDELEIKTKNAD